jgi:hypothetical protein
VVVVVVVWALKMEVVVSWETWVSLDDKSRALMGVV